MPRIIRILLGRKVLIPASCIGAGILFGLIFLVAYQKISFFRDRGMVEAFSADTEVAFGGIVISSDLPSKDAEIVGDFLARNIKKELLPSRLGIMHLSDQSGAKESQYVGEWLAGSEKFNILYVRDEEGNTKYMRAWTLRSEQKINAPSSLDLIRNLFVDSMVQEIDPLRCTDESGGSASASTVCEHMVVTADGNKMGGLVRSPLIGNQGERFILTSICLVPKDSSAFAAINFCI